MDLRLLADRVASNILQAQCQQVVVKISSIGSIMSKVGKSESNVKTVTRLANFRMWTGSLSVAVGFQGEKER